MKNWSLNQKIWSILGLLAFAFIGNTFFSLNSLMAVRDDLNEVTGEVVRRDQLTSEIKDNQRRVSVITMEAILHSDEHQLQENKKAYHEILEKQEKDVAEYESLASEKGKAILERYMGAYKIYLQGCDKTREFAFKQMDKEASEAYLATSDSLQIMRKEITALNDLTSDQLKEKSEDANTEVKNSIMMGIAVSGIAILVSLLIAFFVLKSLTRSINEVVKNLFENSVQVSSAAAQIASSSEELSQASSEQAASLEETASAIEEMSSMVQKNSANAEETAGTSTKSQESAGQGKTIVEKMIQSMDAINHSNNTIMEQVNQSNASVAGIVKVIEEIENKTKVINDIVFQTKLLSFNASVEAARAGEHGKGFAVVAEEVGNLAQMSGNAAKEISALLSESVQKVNSIVHETQATVEKLIAEGKQTVDEGTEVARQCGAVLEEIVHSVSSVSEMSTEISTASQEQARGVTEITKAMGQLDQMTQQNAATSEECASAAEELSAQSESLKNTVNLLVATVSGARNSQIGAETGAVPKASSIKNVIHLKPNVKASTQPLKKVAGDAPTYHNQGFEDA